MIDTAVMDPVDSERIASLRSQAQIALAHLEEMRELDDVEVSWAQWDRAERADFDTLAKLDGALEPLGLERREDLSAVHWYQPLGDHARAVEREEKRQERDEGYGIGY